MNAQLSSAPAKSGWKEILQKDYRRSMAFICLSVWLHASMVTAMSTMIPNIVDNIGGISLVPWTFALYELGSILVGAGSGLIVYRYRLRNPMSIAALVFTLGSMICALANIMPVMLVGRLFQGLGGGGLVAMSFVAIGTLFPSHLMPRAMAIISAIWGTSAFLGPLIGALFVEHLSWQSAFWYFTILSVVLATWIRFGFSGLSSGEIGKSEGRFPVRRLLVLCLGVLLIAAAGINVSTIKTPALVLAGVALLWLFLRMDAKAEDNRLLPKRPIGLTKRSSAGLTTILCFAMGAMAITVYGPLFMVNIHQFSIIAAGYVVALTAVGWSVAAMLVSGVPVSLDTRVIMLGMSILTVGIAGLIYAITEGPLLLLGLLVIMEGFGFGLAWSSILRRMLTLVAADDRERTSAAIPTVHRLGFAIGAAWIGIVANAAGLATDASVETIEFVARSVFVSCLPFALLGMVAAAKFVSSR